MNEPLRKFMRLGLVHWMAYPSVVNGDGPIVETVREIARDDFFEVLEISWIRDPVQRRQVRSIAEVSRLQVYYGGMPRQKITGVNINDVDPSGRAAAVSALKEGMDEAHELGARGFSFMSGKFDAADPEKAYQALVLSTLELCSRAQELGGMPVNLEVFDHDVEHRALLGPVDRVERFAEEIRRHHDNFGIMVDLSHLPQLGETPFQSLVPIRNHIRHAHVGNTYLQNQSDPAFGDKHPRFGYPGSAVDIPEIVEYLRVLLGIGYFDRANRPVLSLEVRPVADEDPALVVANAKRTLQAAWDLV